MELFEIILKVIGAIFALVVAVTAWCLCAMSGKCSRNEEEKEKQEFINQSVVLLENSK